MMKTVYFLLNITDETTFRTFPGAESLMTELQSEGYIVYINDGHNVYDRISRPDRSGLFLTDDPEIAFSLSETGCSTVLMEGLHSEESAVSGNDVYRVKHCITSLEDLPVDYLRLIWDHDHHVSHTIAVTDRTVIRETVRDDFEAVRHMLLSCGNLEKIGDIQPEQLRDDRWFESYIDTVYSLYGYGMWSVVQKSTRRVIGWCGIGDNGQLGYLIDESVREQGYGYEACRAIIDYAKECLGFQEIKAYFREDNPASARLAKKLGIK